MATSSPATSPVPIRLFSGTSMLALPPHRSYRLLADSPQGVEASTQTKPRPKVRHCRALKQKNFNCEVCQKAFRDNYALKEHVKKVHSPAMVEEGGIVCERWFCDMRLPTKYDWQQHMKECFWLCPDPACGDTRLTKHRVFINHWHRTPARCRTMIFFLVIGCWAQQIFIFPSSNKRFLDMMVSFPQENKM